MIYGTGLRSRLATFRLYQSSDGKYYDYTTNVLENTYDSADATTFAELTAMGGTDYLYFGSMERLSGVMLYIADNLVSVAAGTMKIDYWNGSAWTALTINDGTDIRWSDAWQVRLGNVATSIALRWSSSVATSATR